MMHQYTMCGLDYVFLQNGFRTHDTDYGPGVSIEHADDLDYRIALYVLAMPLRLRGQEVRFLRSLLDDASQNDVANVLGIKRLTVGRWESKPDTPIPGPADRAFRLYAAHMLFGGRLVKLILDFMDEIADGPRSKLVMTYKAEIDVEDEPELFPDDQEANEGWRRLAA